MKFLLMLTSQIFDPVDNSIVHESYDNDEFSEGARVKGSDLKFDYIGANENSTECRWKSSKIP